MTEADRFATTLVIDRRHVAVRARQTDRPPATCDAEMTTLATMIALLDSSHVRDADPSMLYPAAYIVPASTVKSP